MRKSANLPGRALALLATGLLTLEQSRAQPMVIAPDRTNGVYQVADTVHWRVEWKGGQSPPAAHYLLKRGGLTEAGRGDLSFNENVATFDSNFDGPNTMLAEVTWQGEDHPNHAWGGAVAAPEKIKPAAPPPQQFGSFWKARLKELKKVPPHPRLEKVDIGNTNVAYWKVTLDNIRGSLVRGQLARPEAGKKFPALLIVQYAGVYGLQKKWVTDRAAEGWLALDIEAHDLPIDQPESYYKEQFAGPLKNYWDLGNDDPDHSYYLRMYLSGYQALEYLTSRPDWNGRTLVVMGTSQGGQQALVLAGLHPKHVSAALALVPAACDMLAPEAGRAPGFPSWYFHTQGKDPKAVHETSRFYDPANFAPQIKCPVLIGLGLHDEVLAPPASILATANEIVSLKEVLILANSGHQNEHGSQEPYNRRCYQAWLPALLQGRSAPVGRAN